jgi:hypothetical protein
MTRSFTVPFDFDRVALIGDVHGDVSDLQTAIHAAADADAEVALALGDWGFIWAPYETAQERRALDAIEASCERYGVELYVVEGNHENFDRTEALEADANGIRWVRPTIGILPRVFRGVSDSGVRYAGLAGAGSPDRSMRQEGRSWWPQEAITVDDLAALGTEAVDVLLGHDCIMTPELDLRLPHGQFDVNDLIWARAVQGMFQRAAGQVRPRISVGGHYHVAVRAHATYLADDGTSVSTYAVTLANNGKPGSCVVLDMTDPNDLTVTTII